MVMFALFFTNCGLCTCFDIFSDIAQNLKYNKCYKNQNKTNKSIKQTETNTEKHDQYKKKQLNTENKQRNAEFYYFQFWFWMKYWKRVRYYRLQIKYEKGVQPMTKERKQ